jgi:hypothetical protein
MMKRHHLLLRALRDLRDSTFRVAIVARNIPEDRQRGILLKAIERSGVARQIDIFEDLTPPQVNEVLNASKVNLLLSRQEGSNRSLFEGFFAGVPGVAFANHIGIPKDHFRAETGRLIRPETLAETLRFLRSRWGEFHPRDWAVAHISAQISTSRLNEVLEGLARERAERWTSGIVAKCNLPGLEYFPTSDAGSGLPRVDDLVQKFGR